MKFYSKGKNLLVTICFQHEWHEVGSSRRNKIEFPFQNNRELIKSVVGLINRSRAKLVLLFEFIERRHGLGVLYMLMIGWIIFNFIDLLYSTFYVCGCEFAMCKSRTSLTYLYSILIMYKVIKFKVPSFQVSVIYICNSM